MFTKILFVVNNTCVLSAHFHFTLLAVLLKKLLLKRNKRQLTGNKQQHIQSFLRFISRHFSGSFGNYFILEANKHTATCRSSEFKSTGILSLSLLVELLQCCLHAVLEISKLSKDSQMTDNDLQLFPFQNQIIKNVNEEHLICSDSQTQHTEAINMDFSFNWVVYEIYVRQ